MLYEANEDIVKQRYSRFKIEDSNLKQLLSVVDNNPSLI